MLFEFQDLTLAEFSNKVPHLGDIKHAIDMVPRSCLPNFPHYIINLIEHAELKQVMSFYRKAS